jgi:hypothetical protein
VNTRNFYDGKINPFLRFYKQKLGDDPSSDKLLVYETEASKKTTYPTFKQIDISLEKLCNGNAGAPLFIELWDFRSNGDHTLLSAIQTSISQIEA